jgi:hypothetical protein
VLDKPKPIVANANSFVTDANELPSKLLAPIKIA